MSADAAQLDTYAINLVNSRSRELNHFCGRQGRLTEDDIGAKSHHEDPSWDHDPIFPGDWTATDAMSNEAQHQEKRT